MKRLEINEKIALLLGFEKLPDGDGHQWIYPKQFYYMNSQVPEYYCPDFLQIIENYRKIQDLTYLGSPRAYTFDSKQQETL